jgi:ubiquinone/menaquinone biosynthesis C-methylase UbiE
VIGAESRSRPIAAPDSASIYLRERRAHWDVTARTMDERPGLGAAYRRRLADIFKLIVPPGQRVLEIGCGRGDLLADLSPDVGVGVDISSEMLRRAEQRHPECRFVQADAHALPFAGVFDFVILSDLANDLWDVQAAFAEIARVSHDRTRVVINTYSRVWELPLGIATRTGLAHRTLTQNWLTVEDLTNLLRLSDLEPLRHWSEVLLPLDVPLLGPLLNRWAAKVWPFSAFALTNLVVARLRRPARRTRKPLVSVIVPARNESGNIEQVLTRTPEMGAGTELIIIEGGSTDDTYAAAQRAIAAHPERRARLLRQPGAGKGDAVRLGFAEARGDVLMILDADLTVPPEDLPRFYDALQSGKAEFINGSRLTYPMEEGAMFFFNLIANRMFGLAFSWLLGQPIRDTLCGTKVLRTDDYVRIAENRTYFGDFDPFGDFDLLFGAAKLGLVIMDVPVRYRARTYGSTNIQRWRHGVLLLRMLLVAARRLKFV